MRYNREIAVGVAQPLSVLIRAFRPILSVVHWINRPFEGKSSAGATRATADEIAALAGMARLVNQITSHQERIMQGALRLSRLRIRDVMIPVEHVSFLSTKMDLPQSLIVAHLAPKCDCVTCCAGGGSPPSAVAGRGLEAAIRWGSRGMTEVDSGETSELRWG